MKFYGDLIQAFVDAETEVADVDSDSLRVKLKEMLDNGEPIRNVLLVSGELNPYIYNTLEPRHPLVAIFDSQNDIQKVNVVCGPDVWNIPKELILNGAKLGKGNFIVDALKKQRNLRFFKSISKQPVHFVVLNDDAYIFENHFNFVLKRSNLVTVLVKNVTKNEKAMEVINEQLNSESIIEQIDIDQMPLEDMTIEGLEQFRSKYLKAVAECKNNLDENKDNNA